VLPIPNIASDASALQRLQQEAAENPTRYRRRLAVRAVLGDVGLSFVQVLPWAAPIFIGAVIYNHPLFYALAAAIVLFLAWVMRPNLRIEGREVSAQEAPELYRQLEGLQRKLGVTRQMRVLIDDQFNASAAEGRGVLGVLGTRFALTLGIPLLTTLDRQQVLAVVAHELGHFSRRHGRLGHWLYRARAGWLDFARYVDARSSALDRFGAWYAQIFVPSFSVRCFVHSRQCEYEADRDAAWAVGSKNFAGALTRVAVIGRLWGKGLPRHIHAWQRTMAEPPTDFLERFETLARKWPAAQLQAWREEALGDRANWSDTHPSLAERLVSIGEEAFLVPVEVNAGSAFFGDHWPTIVKEFDETWSQAAGADWRFAHLRLKHMLGPLLDVDDHAAATLTVEQRLARARALRSFDPAAGLAALQSLYAENPSNPHIKLAYGTALLVEEREDGAEILKSLAKDSITLLHPIYGRLLDHYTRTGAGKEVERWSALCERAATRDGLAVYGFLSDVEAGSARTSSLATTVKTILGEAISLDPCVVSGWLMEGDCKIEVPQRGVASARIHLLVIAIDPTRLEQNQVIDAVALRYQNALGSLIPPDDIPVARAYFTTEVVAKYQLDSRYALGPAA
jgi:Zn-dependent protease with chaperone function